MNGQVAQSENDQTEDVSSGALVSTFGSAQLSGTPEAGGIAVNGASGDIYVSNPTAHAVDVFGSDVPAVAAGSATDVTRPPQRCRARSIRGGLRSRRARSNMKRPPNGLLAAWGWIWRRLSPFSRTAFPARRARGRSARGRARWPSPQTFPRLVNLPCRRARCTTSASCRQRHRDQLEQWACRGRGTRLWDQELRCLVPQPGWHARHPGWFASVRDGHRASR